MNKIPPEAAISCIPGFITGVAFTNNNIDPNSASIVFLVFCVVTALALTDTKSEKLSIFWSSLSPTVMILVMLFRLLFQNVGWISGEKFLGTWIDYAQIGALWLTATFFIALLVPSTTKLKSYIKSLFDLPEKISNQIVTLLEWGIKVLGLLYIIGNMFI